MGVKKWFVYIIQTKTGIYYTGITTDPERRLKEHQSSPKGAKFMRGKGIKGFVFLREGANRSEVSKLEAQIKKLKRAQKQQLIQGLIHL
jgi:putative endonuclease